MCIIWKLLSSNGLLDLWPDELSSKHNCFQGFNQLISICHRLCQSSMAGILPWQAVTHFALWEDLQMQGL